MTNPELTHRIDNQLASGVDVLTATAVRAEHPETKVALGNVAELLQEQANVHRVLTISEGGALVDAAKYVRKPCRATTRSVWSQSASISHIKPIPCRSNRSAAGASGWPSTSW